ncbi:MAG TPA: hypothetical protein VN420_01975 [Candidatus Fimivivens sp.]|nr:hypothetical protein [Candidatus Fimivivens sp.]
MTFLPLLSRWKPMLRTGLLALGTLAVYILFPAESRLNATVQSVLLGAALFVVVPILYVKLILRAPLSSLGFQDSTRRLGFLAVPLVAILVLSVWYVLLRIFPVSDSYFLPVAIRSSFPLFLLYEVVLVGLIAFLYEVFFRGLVLILWLRRFGLGAAFFQAGLFLAFVAVSGNGLVWQDAPLLLSATASGFIASYTRSIPYSWVTAWLVLFLSDVLILVIR